MLKLSVILQFVLDIFTPEWKLLSVSNSGMSILIENRGYNSEFWSDTLIKQFNNVNNIDSAKTNLNNCYSVALLHKIKLAYFRLCINSAAILGNIMLSFD